MRPIQKSFISLVSSTMLYDSYLSNKLVYLHIITIALSVDLFRYITFCLGSKEHVTKERTRFKPTQSGSVLHNSVFSNIAIPDYHFSDCYCFLNNSPKYRTGALISYAGLMS